MNALGCCHYGMSCLHEELVIIKSFLLQHAFVTMVVNVILELSSGTSWRSNTLRRLLKPIRFCGKRSRTFLSLVRIGRLDMLDMRCYWNKCGSNYNHSFFALTLGSAPDPNSIFAEFDTKIANVFAPRPVPAIQRVRPTIPNPPAPPIIKLEDLQNENINDTATEPSFNQSSVPAHDLIKPRQGFLPTIDTNSMAVLAQM